MNIFIIAALLGGVASVVAELPAGAHDPRPVMPKPNVCDDLCDSIFQFFYAKPCIAADCVDHARAMTCGQDIVCSISCGYTHAGCIDSSIFSAGGISKDTDAEKQQVTVRPLKTSTVDAVVHSDSCNGKYASTSTVIVTIHLPNFEQANESTVTIAEATETKDSGTPAVTEIVFSNSTVKASTYAHSSAVKAVRAIRKRQDIVVTAPATLSATSTEAVTQKVTVVNAMDAGGLGELIIGNPHMGPPESGTMTMTGTTWVETMGSELMTYTHLAGTFVFSGTTALPQGMMGEPMMTQSEPLETTDMMMPTLPSSYATVVFNTRLPLWKLPAAVSTTSIYTTMTKTVSVTRVTATTVATPIASETVTTIVVSDAAEILTPIMAVLALVSAIIITFL